MGTRYVCFLRLKTLKTAGFTLLDVYKASIQNGNVDWTYYQLKSQMLKMLKGWYRNATVTDKILMNN